jgi:hypothetical protein
MLRAKGDHEDHPLGLGTEGFAPASQSKIDDVAKTILTCDDVTKGSGFDLQIKRRVEMGGRGTRLELSRTRRPEGMSLEAWQTALRGDFGRAQRFRLENLGTEPVFSEFTVTNPQTKGSYRVAIRGRHPGDNFCSCPDFAVNTLGTCKHIEFTLATLNRRRGGRAALVAGFQPVYSEVYLRYGARREVAFRDGTDCPEPLRRLAAQHFGPGGILRPAAYDRFPAFLPH